MASNSASLIIVVTDNICRRDSIQDPEPRLDTGQIRDLLFIDLGAGAAG